MTKGLRPRRKKWVDEILVGHLVLFKSGVVRTCLASSHRPDGRIMYATFPILRCSWTERPYTVCDRWQLLSQAKRVIGVTKAPVSAYPIARKILEDARTRDRVIDCCDVIGVFE